MPHNVNSTTSERSQRAKIVFAQEKALNFLRAQRKDDWWPFLPGKTASLEATAWSAVALKDDPLIAKQSAAYLLSNQNKDGGWSSAPEALPSDWVSAPVLFALRKLAKEEGAQALVPQSALDRAYKFLEESCAEVMSLQARVFITAVKGPEAVDYALGWPWSKGSYHWIEPTSYALYAFKAEGLPQVDAYKRVVRRANKFIVENCCSVGGWNHGSHLNLGVNLPPYIVTTGEALTALQDIPHHQAVKDGLAFLNRDSEAKEAGQGRTALGLAWSIIAKECYGEDILTAVKTLMAHQKDQGGFGPNLLVTAISAIALSAALNENPLKFSWSDKATVP